MIKKISIFSLTLGLLVSTLAFTACGSDDNDEVDNGGSSSKHIVKIIEEEGSTIYETVFSYDSQGRVVKAVGTESSATSNSHSEKTYQYGELTIISKKIVDGTLSNGQIDNWSVSHSYSLENGRIVKDVEKYTYDGRISTTTTLYSYDSNGSLTSISVSGSNTDSNTEQVEWTNGNISKIGNGTYTYSNVSWIKGFPFYLKGSNMDNYLFSMGYYGIIPRNLPSKYDSDGLESNGWSYAYEYIVQNNLITKVIYTPYKEDEKRHIMISNFTWE